MSAISVIVRTLGRPSLARALRSVSAQVGSELRLVLVQAGGQTVPWPAELPPPAFPVQRVGGSQPLPRTQAAAAGLAAVATRWALFLDDDDELLPGHLAKLSAALAVSPQAVAAHTGCELVRAHESGRSVLGGAFEPWQMLLGNSLPIHSVMFNAERVRQAGVAFDEQFAIYEDWDFWLQVLEQGAFVHAPGVSARYYIHEGAGHEQSSAHDTAHGSAPYRQLWNKWWPRAPAAWWAQALRAGEQMPLERERARQAHAHALGLVAHLDDTRSALIHTQAALQQQVGVAALHLQHAQEQSARADAEQSRATVLAAQVQAAAQEQARLVQQLAATESAWQASQAALHASQSALHASQSALHAEAHERQRTADELRAVLASSSWRITQPLRTAGTQWRTARAQAGAACARRHGAACCRATHGATALGCATWKRRPGSGGTRPWHHACKKPGPWCRC
jgi:hypothetical protein